MKKIKDLFSILLYIFTTIICALFFFFYKLEVSTNNLHNYMDSFDDLLKIEMKFSTFLEKRDKFVNFDTIVKNTNDFENIINSLINKDFKDSFEKELYEKLIELNELYEQKRDLIEKFKSRQATNLNSIHYIYDLNQFFIKDRKLDEGLKNTINSTLFMIMQYFIKLNNTKLEIFKNLNYIKKENEKLSSKELNLLIVHSQTIIKNIDYLNRVEKTSKELNLKKKIQDIYNELMYKHEEELLYQLLISSFFFLSVILMIILFYKEYKRSQIIKDELFAFKYAVENSDNTVVLTDANKNILYVNDIFEKNTGFKREEVFGKQPRILKSGKTPDETYKKLNNKLKLGKKWEGEFINRRKDGTLFYEKASIVPIRIKGRVQNYLAIKLDVTKYIEQNEKIKLSSTAFENIQEGILICDKKEQIITINKAFEKITGYKKSELIGRKPNIFNSGYHNKSFYKKIFQSLAEQEVWKGQIYYRNKKGENNPFWLNVSVVKDKNGVVSNYVGVHTSLKEIISSKEKADFLAYHDSLTKLPNRVKLEEDLTETLKANRNKLNIFILFIDLDRFKIINDTLGHSVGDKLLINIANRIKSVLRDSDILARMGGDEFIVILESCKSKKSAGYVCKKILDIVKEPVEIENNILNTSASIGVAMSPNDGLDMISLIKNADTAMYHAKKLGKDNYQYYDKGLSLDVHEQLQIEQSLKDAILNKELYLIYQPQYNLKNREIVAFEALIRWEHPIFGFINPDKFIPIAEDTGDIIEIGKFVLDTAFRDFVDFKKYNSKLQYIAINISSIQFKDKIFVHEIIKAINKYNLKPSQVELEVTERYIIDFTDNNIKSIKTLRKLGFRFSIDDFGIGYSSLNYLTKLPIDVLKVDKVFIDNTPYDTNNVKISKAIIALSKSLGYKVIAEGIEYKEQEEYLNSLECDMGQGYFFSKPLKYPKIIELLKRE